MLDRSLCSDCRTKEWGLVPNILVEQSHWKNWSCPSMRDTNGKAGDTIWYDDAPPKNCMFFFEQCVAMGDENIADSLKQLCETEYIIDVIHRRHQMKWRKTPPTVPGWYWFRNLARKDDVTPTVVHIRDFGGEGLALGNSYLKGWKSMETAEWAGPIDRPEEV
jgi:hypothetical protein